MIYILASIFLLILIYLYLIYGRVGFTDFKAFKGVRFAHRGFHGNGVPENSLAAFKRAVEHGFGSEFDVHITADGIPVVIHDSSLKRTAGADVNVEDLTLEQLGDYSLENTDEKIPTLKEVLAIFEGKQPIIVELKPANGNFEKLCFITAGMLNEYKSDFCVESFDPRCVKWFKDHRPEFIRGQLSQNYLKKKNLKISFIKRFAAANLLTNVLTKPDFVAYKFCDRNNLSFKIWTKIFKLQGVTWTVTDKISLKIAENENLIPIFEDKKVD